MTRRPPSCPVCGAREALPIADGPGGPGTEGPVRAGPLVAGDGAVARDGPEWRCPRCGYEWRRNEERA